MIRKLVGVVISMFLLLLSGSVLAQDFPSIPEGETVTIRFYSYNLSNATFGPGTESLIAEFMESHPNIIVEGVAVPATDMTARVQADIAAGTPPDVAQLIFDGLDFYVNNFQAVPLESIVPPEELNTHFEGFSPNGLRLGQLNDQTYGLAFTFSTPIFFYNADIFRAAGLDPENPPTNWEEVREAALTIVNNTDYEGVHIAGLSNFDWVIQSLIKSNGGDVLSDDRTTIRFGEPEAIEAIGMWQDLVMSGAHTRLTDGDVVEAVFTGQVGMYLQTSALYFGLSNAARDNGWDLRAAPMPQFGEQPTVPVNSGSALYAFSNDPVRQRASWEFLRFVTSERGYTIIATELGYVPLRPEIVEQPEYLQAWAEANPYVYINLEQLSRLDAWDSYPGSNWRQIENILLEAVEVAVTSDADVTTVMTDGAARAQALMP